MKSKWRRALAAFVVATSIVVCGEARAQGGSGVLGGEVTDNRGQPVIAAQIELTGPALHEPLRSVTDANGRFFLTGLPPGAGFRLKVSADGYNTVVLKALTVSASSRATVKVVLSGGGTSVSVTAAAPAVSTRQTETGASVYRMTTKAIKSLPQGENTPLNEVVLQAPGVAQDSFGQLHVRGDHADLQYRINGLLLPEGINGFGQTLDTRFAQRIDLLTGALPPEYGYRTAGVVDITPKSGGMEGQGNQHSGGGIDLYGGEHGTFQPGVDAGGYSGDFVYYATASSLVNDLGIESPTPAARPLHDHTSQIKGFGYFNYLLGPSTRLSLVLGSAAGTFEIPNNPGQAAAYEYDGLSAGRLTTLYPSSELDATQREVNDYAILALQGEPDRASHYQVALFSRYSSVHYHPDPLGDLVYNGVSADVFRSDTATGLQGDGSYKISEHHTLRAGFFVSGENAVSDNTSQVFSADASGAQTGTTPFTVVDDHTKRGWLYSLYLQDRWTPTSRLSLLYGARLDRVDAYVRGDQFSPRITVIYQATSKLALHAGYAHYFTPPPLELITPTSIAKFQNTTSQVPGEGNGQVVPERSDYYDIGATFRATPDLEFGLDSYYRDVKDLLDEGQFGQALVFSPFNYRKGRAWGVEGTVQYRTGRLDIYGNAALAMAQGKEVVSGQFNFAPDELAYIATHDVHLDHDQNLTLSGGVSYGWPTVRVSLDAIYGSGLRRGFANTQSLPGYLQVNLGLTGGVPSTHLGSFAWRVSVVNMLDRVYEIRDGTGIGVGAPQYGPRRALYVGLSTRF